MEIKAKLRYYRQSSRKVRLVLELIKGLDSQDALAQLEFLNKRAARTITKLLKSALANAENNYSLDPSSLYIKKVYVDQGPTLKRWRARAFGRAASIRKRSSNVTLVLEEKLPAFDQSSAVEAQAPKLPARPKRQQTTAKLEPRVVKSLQEIKEQFEKQPSAKELKPKTVSREEEHKAAITELSPKSRPPSAQSPGKEVGKFKGFIKKVFARKTG